MPVLFHGQNIDLEIKTGSYRYFRLPPIRYHPYRAFYSILHYLPDHKPVLECQDGLSLWNKPCLLLSWRQVQKISHQTARGVFHCVPVSFPSYCHSKSKFYAESIGAKVHSRSTSSVLWSLRNSSRVFFPVHHTQMSLPLRQVVPPLPVNRQRSTCISSVLSFRPAIFPYRCIVLSDFRPCHTCSATFRPVPLLLPSGSDVQCSPDRGTGFPGCQFYVTIRRMLTLKSL